MHNLPIIFLRSVTISLISCNSYGFYSLKNVGSEDAEVDKYSSLWHCDLDALGYAVVGIDIDDAGALALGSYLAFGVYRGYLAV